MWALMLTTWLLCKQPSREISLVASQQMNGQIISDEERSVELLIYQREEQNFAIFGNG